MVKCPRETDSDYDSESSVDAEGVDWYCTNCQYNYCCSGDGHPDPEDEDDDDDDED